MVDVPACCMDLAFELIEPKVCHLIVFVVDQVDNVTGKFLDAPDVVSDCHGISFKRTTRLRIFARDAGSRNRPQRKECKALKKSVAGSSSDPG
jgi:hypothetical protein